LSDVRRAAIGRASAALLCGAAALALGACESSQTKSAQIAKEGSHAMSAVNNLTIAKASTDVTVGEHVVLRGGGVAVAAVELTNHAKTAQADLPVLIDARGGGKSLFKNNLGGLQASLQHMALIKPGATAWWVNDQLIDAAQAKTVSVKVGPGRAIADVPRVTLRDRTWQDDQDGIALHGTVVNHSKATLANVPIYAVALDGGKVVSAGRALVPKLPPSAAGGKPVRFTIFFTGADPRSAHLVLTVAPPTGPVPGTTP
jgi:hypothetical protein